MAGLLSNKSWQAQEYYNEYLELKKQLLSLTEVRNINNAFKADNTKITEEINEKTARFKIVLSRLKEQGVSMEDLVLLGAGINVYSED